MSCFRNIKLPFLPGLVFSDYFNKPNFRKNQTFQLVNEQVRTENTPNSTSFPSIYGRKITTELPSWILYDKQILTFDAYYQCTHPESRDPPQLIRKVKIHFFLEDGTIRVVECKYVNSGITQGTLIARQRIRLPFRSDSFFDVLDLNVGFRVEFYGKIFQVIDCDNFTRIYLNRLGINVPDRLPMPSVISDFYKGAPNFVKKQKTFPFRQFLELDRKILRFYGYWDDRDNEEGRLHRIIVLYFLADDTIQIIDQLDKENGFDSPPTLISRMKIPKRLPPKIDYSDAPAKDTYAPEDLTIGAHIWAFHREIVITDCDEFTREYYRIKYGIDDFTPLPIPKERNIMKIERILPPWNGYGTYEDSALNCKRIEIKTESTSITQFLKKDKKGLNSNVLRFAARLICDIPKYARRLFIVKYYLSDDTISVFELAERNSGFSGGRFASRQTVYLPESKLFVPDPPPKYLAPDLWVGNIIIMNGHQFYLFNADEYAIRYMEIHSEEFPKSNVCLIMDTIRRNLASKANRYKDFVAKYMNAVVHEKKHLMPLQSFKQALKETMCDSLTHHEFITIARFFRGDYDEKMPDRRREIQSMVTTQLVKELWNVKDTEAMELMLKRSDQRGIGTLEKEAMRQALKACRLPIHDHLMSCMLNVLVNDDKEIRISDLLQFVQFKPCRNLTDMEPPCVNLAPPSKDTTCYDWIEEDILLPCGYINWDAFLCELKLTHLLKEEATDTVQP